MKKLLSVLLCFCMLPLSGLNVFAYGESFGSRVLPEKCGVYEKYDPTVGTQWLANQEEVAKSVEEANALPRPDTSIYDMARESIIIKFGENVAYVRGFAAYIDADKTETVAIVENGSTYIPIAFAKNSLGIQTSLDEDLLKCTITAQDENFTYTVINKEGQIFLPLRAISEAAGKKVLYDNRGIVIITSDIGIELLTEEHWDTISQPDFELERDRIMHPAPKDVIRWIMDSGQRAMLTYTDEQIEEKISQYTEMSYSELAYHVEETVKINEKGQQRHIGERPAFEEAILLMAEKYDRYPDEDLALRIIIMSYYSAIHFDDLATYSYNNFYNMMWVAPIRAVYAYNRIFHSPMWEVFEENFGFDAKDAFRVWWTTVFDYLVANYFTPDGNPKPVGNFPIDLGHMVGIAYVLDEPEKIRTSIPLLDSAIDPNSFYADGMWYEGSFDYSNQMVGNCDAAAIVMRNYVDPLGFVDEKYGVRFDGSYDTAKWSNFFAFVKTVSQNAYFPDGSKVAVNDTNWTLTDVNMADNTIKEQYLKDNIELNHFGLFGMRYGDTEEAQQLNIVIAPTTCVSHQEDSYLNISYYSGGMEILPDMGYVRSSAIHRYSKNPIFSHNSASAWKPDPGIANGSYYTRPNVYGYDDGSTNGKQIQLVDASVLMPESYNMDVNRRLLMMIATDKNHSYVLDVHRIKGDVEPEAYLQQTEDEDVEFETSLELPEAYDGMLSTWLQENGAYGGMVNNYVFSRVIVNPQGLRTSDDFWFTWKGKTSGTTLKAFIKGDDDALVAFSTYPTIRRTSNDAAKKDDFPGYHFYRRNDVEEDEVSLFGGVYEGYKEDETGKVLNVTWVDPEDGDDMTAMAKVELPDAYDYIYVSNDLKKRTFEDFDFSATSALVRVDKQSGEIIHSYIYGEGEITGKDFKAVGKPNEVYQVLSAEGSRPTDEVVTNEIKVKGVPTEDIEGLWANVTFANGEGKSLKIKKVTQSTVTLTNDPGFMVSEKGATFTAYPLYQNPKTGKIADFSYPYDYGSPQRKCDGEVIFTAKIPSFKIGK